MAVKDQYIVLSHFEGRGGERGSARCFLGKYTVPFSETFVFQHSSEGNLAVATTAPPEIPAFAFVLIVEHSVFPT